MLRIYLLLLFVITMMSSTWVNADVVYKAKGGYITLKKGTYGNNSAARITNIPLGQKHLKPANEYWLDYWVKYDSGWVEGWGGKLPGLAGGTSTTGCNKIDPEGWSARIMWGTVNDGLRLYLYHQDRKAKCGDNFKFSKHRFLSAGSWHRITEYVKINTPNQKNGIIKFWVDGDLVLNQTNLRLRGAVSSSKARVDRLRVEVFRGGGDSRWEVNKNTTINISDLHVLDCMPNLQTGSPHRTPTCQDQPLAQAQPPQALRILSSHP